MPETFAATDAMEMTNSARNEQIWSPGLLQKDSDTTSANAMIAVYAAAIVFVVLCVTAMYYPMGFWVVTQIVVYICALAFVKLAVKTVFSGYGFFYPKFVTALHLAVSSLAGFVLMLHRSISNGCAFTVPTGSEMLYGILPVALAFGLSIGSENSALVFCSAAFSEIIGASAPVVSALLTWFLGMRFHVQLMVPILVVILGCLVSVSGELKFSVVGTLLLLFAVVCRCFKSVMQQKLMTGATKEKFDPVALMAWTCLLSLLQMIVYSMATEGLAPYNDLAATEDIWGLSAAILVSCLLALILNLSALFVVKHIGAVGMQLVAQMKSALIVIGGIALLHESFTPMEFFGFGGVLIGVYWYSSWKMALEPNAKGH